MKAVQKFLAVQVEVKKQVKNGLAKPLCLTQVLVEEAQLIQRQPHRLLEVTALLVLF
jgi:hypothetical protein